MWFAARDIAFEHPVTDDMTQMMLERMGIVAPGGTPPTPEEARRARRGAAPVPRPRPRARDDAPAHDRAAVHRDLGVPHVRVGRGGALRHATSSPATARRPRSCATSAPTRRRTSSTCGPRSPRCATARSSATSGKKHDGTEVIGTLWDAGARRVARRAPSSSASSRPSASSSTRSRRTRGAPTSSQRFHALGPQDFAREARSVMKFGIFYEHQLPRPWDDGHRVPAHPGRARAGRARRPARHRLRVGGRAPLPRGVLALVARPRCSSPRPVAAHEEHPPRPRHRPDRRRAFNHPARTAERVAMLDLVSNGRVDFGIGRVVVGGRARRLQDRPDGQARRCGTRASRSRCAA